MPELMQDGGRVLESRGITLVLPQQQEAEIRTPLC